MTNFLLLSFCMRSVIYANANQSKFLHENGYFQKFGLIFAERERERERESNINYAARGGYLRFFQKFIYRRIIAIMQGCGFLFHLKIVCL